MIKYSYIATGLLCVHSKCVCLCFYKCVCPLHTCRLIMYTECFAVCARKRDTSVDLQTEMLTCGPLVLSPLSSAACSCHPVGSVLSGGSTLCNPSSGECTCKPGVGGPRCDSCMLGYWGLHEYGCRPCDCTGDCDPYTGDCISG